MLTENLVISLSLSRLSDVYGICDTTTPPAATPPDIVAVTRYQRLPSVKTLHPHVRGINEADLKLTLLSLRDRQWRASPPDLSSGSTSTAHYHTAGAIVFDGSGFWLRRTTYRSQLVWADCFKQRRDAEASWDTASRAIADIGRKRHIRRMWQAAYINRQARYSQVRHWQVPYRHGLASASRSWPRQACRQFRS